MAGWLQWTIYFVEKAILCLSQIIGIYSGYRFVFHACKPYAKTTVGELIECLIHNHGIPQGITFDQGIHFTARKVQLQAHTQGIYWSYHILHPSEELTC